MINHVREQIEKMTAHSAWKKGVKDYALELLDNVTEEDTVNCTMLKKALLNGAENWNQYSYGGCSLIYDSDIAERLCNPSELKRTRNGKRRPNRWESWLDVQTRALYQACHMVTAAATKIRSDIEKIKPLYINDDTISTINKQGNGNFILRFYKNKMVIFEKEYKTFTSARIAEGKLMKKYY